MNVLSFLLIAIIAVICVWLAPLLMIWAINVLFNLHIAYSLINWFAMLLLIAVFGR